MQSIYMHALMPIMPLQIVKPGDSTRLACILGRVGTKQQPITTASSMGGPRWASACALRSPALTKEHLCGSLHCDSERSAGRREGASRQQRRGGRASSSSVPDETEDVEDGEDHAPLQEGDLIARVVMAVKRDVLFCAELPIFDEDGNHRGDFEVKEFRLKEGDMFVFMGRAGCQLRHCVFRPPELALVDQVWYIMVDLILISGLARSASAPI
jgi:hypothetical protein